MENRPSNIELLNEVIKIKNENNRTLDLTDFSPFNFDSILNFINRWFASGSIFLLCLASIIFCIFQYFCKNISANNKANGANLIFLQNINTN